MHEEKIVSAPARALVHWYLVRVGYLVGTHGHSNPHTASDS